MNYNKIITLYVSLSVLLLVLRGILGIHVLGYIIYFIILIPLLYIFLKRQNKAWYNNQILPFLILLIFIIISMIINNEFNNTGILQLIIIISTVVPFILYYDTINKKIDNNIHIYNNIVIFIFIVFYGFNILKNSGNILSIELLSGKTSLNTESNVLSFIFGLLFTHSLKNKDKRYMMLNGIFILLSFKRIVILSTIIVIILSIIKYKILKKYILILSPIIIYTFIYITYLLTIGEFDRLILKHFGVSAGQFTSGRTSFYSYVLLMTSDSHLINYFFGHGFGYITNIVESMYNHKLHSDILKLYFEIGLLGLTIFIITLIKYTKNIFATICLIIYFMTDNTITYSFVILTYLLIQKEYKK